MKNNWIHVRNKMPILGEIIYYNNSPREVRHQGNERVLLHNGELDSFDLWRPKNPGFVTCKILHLDGITKIEAKGKVEEGLFITEYRHDGMTYGAQVPLHLIK